MPETGSRALYVRSVAIFEGVDGHEPQMRHTRLKHEVGRALFLELGEEVFHFRAKAHGRWSFIMNTLLSDRPRNHLQGALLVLAPAAHLDFRQATSAGREKRGLPVKQALHRQRVIVVQCRIEHHFDNALDVTVRWRQAAHVDSEPARDRRAHLVPIEPLPLNLARFEDILG